MALQESGAGGQASVGDLLEEQGKEIPSEDVQTHRPGPDQKQFSYTLRL